METDEAQKVFEQKFWGIFLTKKLTISTSEEDIISYDIIYVCY